MDGRASPDRRANAQLGGVGVRKRHGRHYTPPQLARFLAERVVEHAPARGALRVLDPACGDGELLLALRDAAARRYPDRALRLVGYDLDADAVRMARERTGDRRRGAVVDWHVGDFLSTTDELADGSFDAVITNPPYVRTQQLGSATARWLSLRFGLTGRIDLTHPFVASVPRLLSPGGVLGLLCANRFLTTKAGANLRALLCSQLTPVELYDLGDTRLFEAAVLPAITVALRGDYGGACRYVSAYELAADDNVSAGELFSALSGTAGTVVAHAGRAIAVEIGTLAADSVPHLTKQPVRNGSDTDTTLFDPSVPWRMSRPAVDEWLRRVSAGTWRTFGEVARIRVGIKTTADRVFIADDWEQREPRPESELLFDLITHHDLAPWRITRRRATRVLYPYDVTRSRRTPVDLAEFPSAAAYLAEHRDVLDARGYVTAGGREWYEIWVPQRPRLWARPKLVFPDISVAPRFALDRTGAIVNGDCYWISLPDLADETLAYLLMGVANSTLGLRYYDAVCGNRLYAGRRRWITQYVARLPLPDPTTPEAAALVGLVRDRVDAGQDPDPGVLDEAVAAAFGLGAG